MVPIWYPMVFLQVCHSDFLMVPLWFSYDFLYDFLMVPIWYPMVFLRFAITIS